MHKEDVDVANEIKAEISKVIDQWVNDLIRTKIAAPMPQQHQRGLWDRIKGTLSNLWYAGRGGRYNQNNPYYWRNRFGDDLGAQTESYNPRAFDLQEYKVLKSIVEETESFILENTSPDVEKLRIVQIIRSSAEKLKQDLINIFASSCSGDNENRGSSTTPATGPGAGGSEDASRAPGGHTPVSKVSEIEDDPPSNNSDTESPSEVDEPEVPAQPEPEKELRLSKERYINYKPKSENDGKDLEELITQKQLVDAILHPDFEKSTASFEWRNDAKEIVLKLLEDLLHDADLKGARHGVAQKIEKAIDKFKDILSKEE